MLVVCCTACTTTNETYTSIQEQTSEQKTHDYNKILNGDLSDFSGKWKNNAGEIMTLSAHGTMEKDYTSDGVTYKEKALDFEKIEDGSYVWNLVLENYDEANGYGVYLYPVGVEIVAGGVIVQTDKTRVRIYVGQDFYPANEMTDKIFYLD